MRRLTLPALGLTVLLLAAAPAPAQKDALCAAVEARAERSWEMARQIWLWAEPGYQEKRSAALLAGALLSFALSFDEIIVTTFTAGQGIQTLPLWIYQNLFRPNQAPVVNVVAAALIVLSIIPIWLSQKLAGTDESVAAVR